MPREDVSRVHRSKAAAQAAYDRMSGWYDLLTDPFESKYRRLGLELLKPGQADRILEIGSGPGQALVNIADSVGPQGRVIGLDLSRAMLRRAKVRLSQARAPASLAQGDGARLPFVNGAFDGLFLSFTLELFDTPEIPIVLAECRRVLVSEGRLVVVSMAKQSDPNSMARLYEWAHERFPRYADCRPIWVQQDLKQAGFNVQQRQDFSMMGLAGAVVRARKP